MTNEEKQLLLIDLCARLPYGVKTTNGNGILELSPRTDVIYIVDNGHISYLRSMSSMTEDEALEMFSVMYSGHELINVEIKKERVIFGNKDVYGKYSRITLFFNRVYSLEQLDWFNKNMFDYRGLIHMRLALEAPEGMYKTE